MPTGAIQFVADSSQLTTASAEARKSVASVAASAEEARQRIVASYRAQVAAAKEAGGSLRQLDAITRQSSSALASVTEDNARRYINSIDRMEERTRKFNVARASLATAQAPVSSFTFGGYGASAEDAEKFSKAIQGVGESAGYAVAPSVRFGSVLRAMEGGFTRNIRSAEYFGASLKFLGPLLGTAFPLVGAVTLGYALVQMGKHAYDAFENIVLLRDAIKGLNTLQINVDSTINRNADAAEASVESILNATQGKTAADRQKYAYAQNKPLDNSSYFYSKEFSGLGSNAKADYEKRFKSIAPGDINNSQAAINAELAQLQAAKASQNTQGAFVQKVGGYGPSASEDPQHYFDLRIKALQQIKALTDSGASARSASLQSDQAAIPKDQAEDIKKKAQEAKSAREAAMAAVAQLNAKAIAQQNQNLLDWEAFQDRSKLDTVLYWSSIVALTNDGSKRALDANQEYQKAQIALNRENAEALKSAISGFSKDYLKDFTESSGLGKLDTYKLTDDGHQNALWITSLAEGLKLTEQNKNAMAEFSTQMAVASGQMTKLDAARTMAALHSLAYQKGLKEFADKDADINGNLTIVRDDAAKHAALAQNANQRDQFVFAGQQQSARDQQAASPGFTSPAIGALDALNDFVAASRDAAGAMRDVVNNTLNGLNNSIVNAATGGKTDFGKVFANTGRSLLGAGLKGAEGLGLSAIGIGKMGSKGNPLYTINAGGSANSPAASALSSLIPSSKGTGVAGFFGGLMKTVLPFLATGGDFTDGAIVGENGPEILKGSGSIASNRTLKTLLNGNSGPNITYSIDARGTDAVQVQQRVRTAIVASHQSAVNQSVKQVQQQSVRKPVRSR